MTSAHATLDVHIGVWSPVRWDEIDQMRVTNPGAWGSRQRPPITSEAIKWDDLGLTPRWVDDDSSQAVAAIEPSRFHDQGAQEWERFCAGADGRGELALALSTLRPDDKAVRTALSRPSASVSLTGASSSGVGGEQIMLASSPELAPGVSGADRDLALRLVSRPVGLPWWSLDLYGHLHQRPEGQLSPLLVSAVGEVVAAVWTSPGGGLRHYILPFMPSYVPLLGWLVDQAVPEFVPSAARRLRTSLAGEPLLQTTDEARTRTALHGFEADVARRRAGLQANVAEATAQADEVRDPLLYGAGKPLVGAVRRVLSDAGIDVVDLDELLGETVSADLLASHDGRRVLVEVKAATGNAGERLAEAPARHLATWSELHAGLPVSGVVLVLNHQTKTHPLDRTAPYTRSEFVASLSFPVLTTRELFDWWRVGNFAQLRSSVMGNTSPGLAEKDIGATLDAERGAPSPER